MDLTLGVTLAVLAAGFLHAGWNALLKSSTGGDVLLDTAAVVAGSSICSFALLAFVPLPDPAAWKFIAASATIHFGYYLTLVQAYRTGDLSFAYPLMRGTAPLIVTVLGSIFLRELPSIQMTAGILLISLGIVSIAFVQTGGRRRHPPAAAYWAFANAAIIAVYTLVDGAGARSSGNALSYVCWLIFLEGIPFVAWVLTRRGAAGRAYLHRGWRVGLGGGACSLAAYGIVLWAMTRAPIAAVAALRETSVLFAALIGSLWLKEGFGWRRVAG
ncbi:MAG TPA: EamA family transporter, partial [Casimicrobiaceae bacterium]|nr:EamA family transporter [Casimicrobiaceae bacterium]